MNVKPIQTIAIIGSGNLASHLCSAFMHAQRRVHTVVSRNPIAGRLLATRAGADYVAKVEDCPISVDLIVLAVSDSAIESVVRRLPENQALVVHISGSTDIDAVDKFEHHGVFYPLQSFTKDKEVNFFEVPFLIEGASEEDEARLSDLGKAISTKVFKASSDDRRYLHVAAVFASNFSNVLYGIAKNILESNTQLPFELLYPLIKETAVKIKDLPPHKAQTGPASRGDKAVMERQLELLKHHREWIQIYHLLSDQITKQKNA